MLPHCMFVQLSPPLIPPRGEVNAADAFDIGSFDSDETKGVKVHTYYIGSSHGYLYCVTLAQW